MCGLNHLALWQKLQKKTLTSEEMFDSFEIIYSQLSMSVTKSL